MCIGRVGKDLKIVWNTLFFNSSSRPYITLYTHNFFHICRQTYYLSQNVLEQAGRLVEIELWASEWDASPPAAHWLQYIKYKDIKTWTMMKSGAGVGNDWWLLLQASHWNNMHHLFPLYIRALLNKLYLSVGVWDLFDHPECICCLHLLWSFNFEYANILQSKSTHTQ